MRGSLAIIVLVFVSFVACQYDEGLLASLPPSAEPVEIRRSPSKTITKDSSKKTTPKPVIPESEESLDGVMKEFGTIAKDSGIACPSDILFVVDSTSSVKSLFQQYKEYVIKVLEGLTISKDEDRVGVILFSGLHIQKEKIGLGKYKDAGELFEKIKSLRFISGVTAMGAALNFTQLSLQSRRKDVRTNVVVLTDGFSYDLIETSAKKLRDVPNVKVFAVTIGDSFVQTELEMIAGSPDHVLKGFSSYAKLVSLVKSCKDGKRSLEKLETATVKFRAAPKDKKGRFLIPNPKFIKGGVEHFDDRKEMANDKQLMTILSDTHVDNPCTKFKKDRLEDSAKLSCKNDILFIFDASGSLKSNFENQLKLAIQVVDTMVIGKDDTKIAAIKYAGKHKSRVILNFKDSQNKEKIISKISKTVFTSGTTFTNEALMKAVELFKEPHVKKDGAKKIAIIFTDGFSFEDPEQGAIELRKLGVTTYVIGITGSAGRVNMDELKTIAGNDKHIYIAPTFSGFVNDVDIIQKQCALQKKKKRFN